MHIGEAKTAVKVLLSSDVQRITPFVKGHPGIGKSAIISQIKEELEFDHLIDLRLSQHDNTDIKGAPRVVESTSGNFILNWIAPEFMPLEGSRWEGTSGILFIDEINRADPQTLQSVFQLIYDGAIGLKKILPKWKIVCAGNRGFDDGTDVFELDAAFLNRVAIIDVDDRVNLGAWMDWAGKHGVHRSVMSFIDKNPSLLYLSETPGKYVTPRSWEQISSVLNDNKGSELPIAKLIARSIVHDATPQFLSHLEVSKSVTPGDVLTKYASVKAELKNMERMLIYSLSFEINKYIESEYKEKEMQNDHVNNLVNYFNEILTDKDHQVAFFTDLSKNTKVFEQFVKLIPEHNDAKSALTEIMLNALFKKGS